MAKAKMRRFVLVRLEDVSGTSGVGKVAEGILFTDGRAVMRWYGKWSTITIYDSLDDLVAIHGHGGKTIVEWVD